MPKTLTVEVVGQKISCNACKWLSIMPGGVALCLRSSYELGISSIL
jgi:hypothetical protein